MSRGSHQKGRRKRTRVRQELIRRSVSGKGGKQLERREKIASDMGGWRITKSGSSKQQEHTEVGGKGRKNGSNRAVPENSRRGNCQRSGTRYHQMNRVEKISSQTGGIPNLAGFWVVKKKPKLGAHAGRGGGDCGTTENENRPKRTGGGVGGQGPPASGLGKNQESIPEKNQE